MDSQPPKAMRQLVFNAKISGKMPVADLVKKLKVEWGEGDGKRSWVRLLKNALCCKCRTFTASSRRCCRTRPTRPA